MSENVLVPCPAVQSLHNILPQEPLLMMGAGPVPIPDRVAKANSMVINHLGETMGAVIEQVKSMTRYVFQTNSPWVMGIAGPGSAAMEMAAANLVEAGDIVLSLSNGFFSNRMAQMAERVGGVVTEVSIDTKATIEPDWVRTQIEKVKPKIITMVHGETSNTVCNIYLQDIAKIAKEYDCLLIVDAICTLSTMPLKMDEWQVDAVITGGQKGLSSIPGVSLLAFSELAWNKIKNRKKPIVQWCLDANLAENFWHKNGYHYTAPVSGIMAIHEALKLVCEETIDVRFQRHLRCSLALQHGIEGMGLELFIPQAYRLNSVIGICLPEGITAPQICQHISTEHKVEISGSFGQPVVRIGQMGEQCREHNLFRTLHAFGCTMRELGVSVDLPNGMAELESYLQSETR